MPYGPEVSLEERDGNGSIDQRGLHLVCYQSSIVRGFKFIQQGKVTPTTVSPSAVDSHSLPFYRMVQRPRLPTRQADSTWLGSYFWTDWKGEGERPSFHVGHQS